MTIGPDPIIRIFLISVRFGMRALRSPAYSSTRPYTIDVSGAASSRLYSTSSMRPLPTHTTWPSPQSCSPSTLMRFSTRSLMACASREASLCDVKEAQSGFWPPPSSLRYEIRYFGIGRSCSFLVCGHQRREPLEQVVRVVRSRRRLGVVLHREHGPLAMPHALARVVVEVQVRRLPAARRHGGGVDGEVVVLRRDLHAARRDVLHRMIGAVVAEGQLVSAPARGEAEDLV